MSGSENPYIHLDLKIKIFTILASLWYSGLEVVGIFGEQKGPQRGWTSVRASVGCASFCGLCELEMGKAMVGNLDFTIRAMKSY